MVSRDIYFLYNLRKWVFIALVAISFILLYIMNNSLRGQGFTSLIDVLSLPELKSDFVGDSTLNKASMRHGNSQHKHHSHENQIGFVLHESDLGEPEFIGRNQKDASFMEDDPNTFLNVEDSDNQINPLFTDIDYPERSVAVGCALTTRNEFGLTPETITLHLPFFRGLLSSFCTTATKGFNYHFYVAHDHTDPFFNIPDAHETFTNAFYEHLTTQCSRKINTTLHLVECHHSGHPAWAQNDAMMAAYMDSMDYYYRVNDDTVMETTGWTEKFINELKRFNPPNVGVVGPWFKEGNIVILTHDFVHRTHIDMFGFYYPRVFTDWFADDWITNVYWPERCRKVPGTRVKHTMEKGQRYVAHYEKASKVKVESDIGKNIITRYIERTVEGKVKGYWDTNAVGVVSMSLYGNDVGLIYGCLRYAQLLPIMFPKWRMRVYVSINESSSKVLKIMAKKLDNFGVEVINLNGTIFSDLPPQLWRYLVMADPTVGRFIIRDANTRPSEREFVALEDWKNSSNPDALYSIRDHISHSKLPLSPGMIGGIPAVIGSLIGFPVEKILLSSNAEKHFLNSKLWPYLSNYTFSHDSVSCHNWSGSHPYPALRSGNEFVGRKFDSNDQPVPDPAGESWLVADFTTAEPCVVLKNTGFYEKAVRSVVKLRPVIWSQDYHVTPMMDIRSLLEPIGVKIIDNSLSYHCGKIGTCAKNLKVINSDNGMVLGEKIIRKFYKAYKNDPTMASVTAFVCTLPISMCEAFRPFNKSMIIWASIRYEQARSEPEQWRTLNRLLAEVAHDRYSVLAANNLYDAKYIEYFTGLKSKLIPNYCAYITETYKPTRKQFLVTPIHSSELYDIFFAEFDNVVMKRNLDLVIFPLREMYPQYLYSDLVSHKGIIYIPYQVSMISLTEQYRMNIPLFFPSLDLLTQWHLKYQVVRQRTWSGYMMKRSDSSNIKGIFPQVPDPNNDVDEDSVRYWMKFADFYQWPHLIYFDSIDDLVDKMLNVDLNEISRRMTKQNNKIRRKIKTAWSEVLIKVTANSRKPAQISIPLNNTKYLSEIGNNFATTQGLSLAIDSEDQKKFKYDAESGFDKSTDMVVKASYKKSGNSSSTRKKYRRKMVFIPNNTSEFHSSSPVQGGPSNGKNVLPLSGVTLSTGVSVNHVHDTDHEPFNDVGHTKAFTKSFRIGSGKALTKNEVVESKFSHSTVQNKFREFNGNSGRENLSRKSFPRNLSSLSNDAELNQLPTNKTSNEQTYYKGHFLNDKLTTNEREPFGNVLPTKASSNFYKSHDVDYNPILSTMPIKRFNQRLRSKSELPFIPLHRPSDTTGNSNSRKHFDIIINEDVDSISRLEKTNHKVPLLEDNPEKSIKLSDISKQNSAETVPFTNEKFIRRDGTYHPTKFVPVEVKS